MFLKVLDTFITTSVSLYMQHSVYISKIHGRLYSNHISKPLTTHHRQDRQDLIQSELAGLAFDSLQQVFRKVDINFAFETAPLDALVDQTVWLVVDPAAGGPSSDFAVLSMSRQRGSVTVSASREQIAV